MARIEDLAEKVRPAYRHPLAADSRRRATRRDGRLRQGTRANIARPQAGL